MKVPNVTQEIEIKVTDFVYLGHKLSCQNSQGVAVKTANKLWVHYIWKT